MEIIYPIFAQVLLTFAVGFSLGVARLISIRKGQVNQTYFRLMSGDQAPDYVVKLSRNFSNLFEVPLLFYVLGILALVLQLNSPWLHGLAWAFVALRFLHTMVHVTYNKPKHRFYCFLLSVLVLLAMWVQVILLIP